MTQPRPKPVPGRIVEPLVKDIWSKPAHISSSGKDTAATLFLLFFSHLLRKPLVCAWKLCGNYWRFLKKGNKKISYVDYDAVLALCGNKDFATTFNHLVRNKLFLYWRLWLLLSAGKYVLSKVWQSLKKITLILKLKYFFSVALLNLIGLEILDERLLRYGCLE